MLSLLDLLLFSTSYEFAIKHEHQTRKWEHDKEFKPEDYDEVFWGFQLFRGKPQCLFYKNWKRINMP